MSIERNIIFLYPISKGLQELKSDLEENDPDVMVYELDSVNEYGQLIGVMEHSITFSSDLKKTEAYLNDCKQFVKAKTSKNIIVQEKTIPPHIFTKLQRLGLNEVMPDGTAVKNMKHKINMFFSPFEQALKKEEEKKNKAVTEQFSGSSTLLGKEAKKETYGGSEKLRVEKMATLDEEKGQLKSSKKKSGFDLNTMLGGGGLNSNFILKKNETDMSMLKSPFDQMQRKKVATFDPVAAKSKLKKSGFKPVEREYGKNPYKGLGIKPPGELNQRKRKNFEATPKELERRKVNFEQKESDLLKKRKKFEEVQRELNRKKINFEEAVRDLEKKKATLIDEAQNPEKAKKKFEEVLLDLKKKKVDLDLMDEELKKKKNLFEEVEAEINKKRNQFEEAGDDLEKKKGLILDLEDLQRKKNVIFEEYEGIQKKKKNFVEEELEGEKLKKLNLNFFDEEEKKKGLNLDEIDYNKKKGTKLDENELSKKKLKFEEVELDSDKKNANLNLDNEYNKKDQDKFKEVENSKEHNNIDLKDPEYQNKSGDFEEVKKENKLDLAKKFVIGKKSSEDELNDGKEKKEFDENILDYGEFKKQYKEGSLDITEEDAKEVEKKYIEKILEEPEYTFYDNRSFGLEYLVIHNDFLLRENVSVESLFKFIHFALIKEYDGDITFYLYNPAATGNASVQSILRLYSGHITRKNEILQNDYDEFEKEFIDIWKETKIPTWKDETYQIEINEFIYPYFEDGQLLGFAIGHFKESVHTHEDAAKIELLTMCLKGCVLEEYMKNNEK